MSLADEAQLLSCLSIRLPEVSRVLVVAPHPDDEVFGCGGTLALLQAQGAAITVLIVSDGAQGGPAHPGLDPGRLIALREQESLAAARPLGLAAPHFWRLPDRAVPYDETLIARLQAMLQETAAELVFLPSPCDWHPDHQTLAFAGAEAARRQGGGLQVAFYEVTDPLPCPNLLLDISSVAEQKQQAMRCFTTQLDEQPYLERTNGINCFRATHLGARVQFAEAFHLLEAASLSQGWSRLLEGPLAQRQRLGHATEGADMPLVSVLIRSMDRPTLDEALDSVARQTWPNIEIVLVNARGPAHRPLPEHWGRLPLRRIDGDGNHPLHRSRAANLGLAAARGDYLIFLDDDDWFDADHLHRLVTALQTAPEHHVAYSGIRCVDGDGQVLEQVFDEPYHGLRLLAENFMPIHAVLFARNLRDQGCHIDEQLDVYEDWDFWLQLAQHGDFLHVPGSRAVYRITQGSGFGVRADPQRTRQAMLDIYRKWQLRVPDTLLIQLMHTSLQARPLTAELTHLSQQLAECRNQLAATEQQQAAGQQQLVEHQQHSRQHIASLDSQLALRQHQIEQLNAAIAGHGATITALQHSTSWRITRPLRLAARLLRGQRPLVADGVRYRLLQQAKRVYWHLPPSLREPLLHWSYRHLGRLFRGRPHYEQWRAASLPHSVHAAGARGGQMLLLASLPPAAQAEGRIAIHLHMYYEDLADEFAGYLQQMPFAYDLYVSVAHETGREVCQETFAGLPRQQHLAIEIVANRGRDIAPMFCTFGDRLKDYDFIAHLHSKKSLYNKGATEGWRQYLCTTLLGSEANIRRIFGLMQDRQDEQNRQPPHGIVYPQNYHLLPYAANSWLANRGMGQAWCARLGIPLPQGYFDFPAGSMFWARGDALRPLFDAGITLEDFAVEAGQTDGTFAHCLERLLGLTALSRGFPPAVLCHPERHDWSAWGFHQYLARPYAWMCERLVQPGIQLLAFDIFDTLLVRPLLDAETTKRLVARHLDDDAGRLYLQYRAAAESRARQQAGRDIGMDEIYAELAVLSGRPAADVQTWRTLEERLEQASVTARPEALALYRQALDSGKPVVLISDMFLPRPLIEAMLRQHGFDRWDQLFLSGEIGVRKDSGQLYEHVLQHYALQPAELLMIGDNERSDLQVPADLGCQTLHILRPVEFARGLPRLRPLIEATEQADDLDAELTLGLILRRHYTALDWPDFDPASLFPPNPYNLGYSLVGPLLTAFSEWLLNHARQDGIDRLYFLAREGQLIQRVFDTWTNGRTEVPTSHYLVLSRRAVSVPMLASMDDLRHIARATFYPNRIDGFLTERFGLQLPAKRWAQLEARTSWSAERTVSVFDQQIEPLLPLLTELQEDIRQQAERERQTLVDYLDQMGCRQAGRQAVVDVGYGATIQDYLNRLTQATMHGYYLMTNQTAHQVGARHGVLTRGCLAEDVVPGAPQAPILYQHSFALEKLLSSKDAQLLCYERDATGRLVARHRTLSAEELDSAPWREELQEGVMQFVQDARQVRQQLLPTFCPSAQLAEQLYATFITAPSPREKDLLQGIALDDHYCGRGVVR